VLTVAARVSAWTRKVSGKIKAAVSATYRGRGGFFQKSVILSEGERKSSYYSNAHAEPESKDLALEANEAFDEILHCTFRKRIKIMAINVSM
jgi:hypothetical protein